MQFGGVVVLENLSISLPENTLRCIIGPNGCGKTTLYNIVTGAFAPTKGNVSIGGRIVTGKQPQDIARLGVARKFQVPGVYPELSVVENLEVPLARRSGNGPWDTILNNRPRRLLDDLLDLCGLAQKSQAAVGTLAHGEKQWLEIAMLVAMDAQLILLDEPTAGMSVVEKESTADLIKKLRRDLGKTVLVIEHDMTFVQLLDCPVVVMMNGTILREGTYEEVRADRRVIDAYLGKGVRAC